MSGGEFSFEEWRDIPNYEGYYQASSMGRVRSLDRTVVYINGREQLYKGRIIGGSLNKGGYRQITLTKDNIGDTYKVSQLVAMAFFRHKPDGYTLVVDHINGDKLDDMLGNLRIVTHRTNVSTCFRSDRDSLSSKYVGVIWRKDTSKWKAQITFKGYIVNLGCFTNESKASNAYQSALSKIEDGSFNPNDYKPKWTSKYKGVSFHKAHGKWQARITIDGKLKHIGYYPTEFEAHRAYQLWEEKPQDIF